MKISQSIISFLYYIFLVYKKFFSGKVDKRMHYRLRHIYEFLHACSQMNIGTYARLASLFDYNVYIQLHLHLLLYVSKKLLDTTNFPTI